ncbi:hypothetical protein INS49_014605 [Diaporthe citri]|uniref:uncharacterized protein n=1 Tax=Diaporthe citri TaxID=83186 RepID=UPI001C824113|nr:uncharacterized protein INS49_014605 [Diaporthe citri]KAG6356731.1 hypothetical protein INS49_014605 [Diaporthe citri]
MAFLEDPRLRQRWNQISHNAETVTETAAEGIWTFQHRYINPCLGAVGHSIESCTAPCFGDRDDRARRARVRGRDYGARAEYAFDFYDDWDDDDEALAAGGGGSHGGGILGGWAGGGSSRGDDWDRLIGGSGAGSRKGNLGPEVVDQPRRKRGMSYGTRGARRKTNEEEDPTIIPSTAPLGFLGRLPWKIGGTLRYKPSAAFLQDHPGAATHPDENQPLLDSDGDEDVHPAVTAQMRKRSGTAGSGDTSDSYRSRGDLFPSDGEGEEDAIPLDDEFAMNLNRADDRASNRTRSSKGKRPASRNVSATTLSSSTSNSSLRARKSSHGSLQAMENSIHSIVEASLEDLQREEEEAEMQEDQEVARKREVAAELARQRGLSTSETFDTGESEARAKSSMLPVGEILEPQSPGARQGPERDTEETGPFAQGVPGQLHDAASEGVITQQVDGADDDFVPARLPSFR